MRRVWLALPLMLTVALFLSCAAPVFTPFVVVVPKGYVSPVWIVLDPEGRMFRWSSAGTVPFATRPGVPPSVRYVGAWLGCGVVRSRPAIVTPARPEGLWWGKRGFGLASRASSCGRNRVITGFLPIRSRAMRRRIGERKTVLSLVLRSSGQGEN